MKTIKLEFASGLDLAVLVRALEHQIEREETAMGDYYRKLEEPNIGKDAALSIYNQIKLARPGWAPYKY